MNPEIDSNTSDSESDEDYCPDKDAANMALLSEEEEEGDVDDVLEDDNSTGNVTKSTRRKKETVTKVDARELEGENENEKSRTDALWADFLSDVKSTTKTTNTTDEATKKSEKIEKKEISNNTSSIDNGRNHNEKPKEIDKEKEATNENPISSKKIIEVLDFAGEEIRVEKTIFGDGVKENKLIPTKVNAGDDSKLTDLGARASLKRPLLSGGVVGSSRSGGGIGNILNQIGKKKKLSVLEKSKMDWNNFKQDEGIEEQLQTFNKGRDGYLERQDFLQRTDLRQFEIEKNLRKTTRRNP